MSFLWPWVWGLSILAIVPILLFYLIRQRPRPITVSTFLFWDLLTPQTRSNPLWRRLRRWISWLLQVLFLLLLLFALAQPFFSGTGQGQRDLILILDANPSMEASNQEGNSWQQAIHQAHIIIGQMRSIDRAMILLAGEEPQIVQTWSRDRQQLKDTLQPLSPATRPSNVETSLRLAHNLITGNPSGEILLFSDLVWSNPPAENLMSNVQVFHSQVRGSHAGIVQFSGRRSHNLPGQYQLHAEVAYEGDTPWTGEVQLWRNERLVDIRPLEVESGGKWQYQWKNVSTREQSYRLELVSNNPGQTPLIQSDQRAFLIVPEVKPRRVAVIGPRDPYIEAVLRSIPSAQHVYALSDTPLPDLLLILQGNPPEDVTHIPSLYIQPTESGFWGNSGELITAPSVLTWANQHPLLEHVDVASVKIASARHYTPPPDAEGFIEGMESPLLYGRWDENRKWLVLAFNIHDSNLVFRTAFPIFISNLLYHLKQENSLPQALLPGETVTRLQPLSALLADHQPTLSVSSTFSPFLYFPLWYWALITGLAWVFLEWALYHRRITE